MYLVPPAIGTGKIHCLTEDIQQRTRQDKQLHKDKLNTIHNIDFPVLPLLTALCPSPLVHSIVCVILSSYITRTLFPNHPVNFIMYLWENEPKIVQPFVFVISFFRLGEEIGVGSFRSKKTINKKIFSFVLSWQNSLGRLPLLTYSCCCYCY